MVEIVTVQVTNIFKGKFGIGDAIVTGRLYKKERGDYVKKLIRLKINVSSSTARLPQPGEFVQAKGHWVAYKKSTQLLVEESSSISIPVDILDLELIKSPLKVPSVYKYIFKNHPNFSGIGLGVKRLQNAVDSYGSFRVFMVDLENRNTKGITEAFNGNYIRAKAFINGYHSIQSEIDTEKFLNESGLDIRESKKIVSLLGTKCHMIIRSNPYCLLAFGTRLIKKGWIIAEKLKVLLKIDDSDPRRLLGAVDKIVYDALSLGHTSIPIDDALNSLFILLNTKVHALAAIQNALKSKTACIVGEFIQGTGPAELEINIEKSFSSLLCNTNVNQQDLFGSFQSESIAIEADKYADFFHKKNGYELVDKQIKAIKMAFTGRITVLQGESGTGKTTALSGIKAVANKVGKPVYFITLAGIAQRKIYRNLKTESLVQFITNENKGDIKSSLNIEEPTCFTIHAFINAIYNSRKSNLNSHLKLRMSEAPIIVMDEASMPDLGIFNRLLDALSGSKYHLFMAGDIGQLAPIGFGVVWHKLHESKYVPYIELDQVHRQSNENPLKKVAQAIRIGKMPRLPLFDKKDIKCGAYFSESKSNDLIITAFENAVALGINETQIIAPTKNTAKLINKYVQNKRISKKIIQDPSSNYMNRFYLGDRVICTKNNHELGLQNGDIGEFVGVVLEDNTEYAHFSFQNRDYKLLEQDVFECRIQLGWCITIHKTQGSEFNNTIIALPTLVKRESLNGNSLSFIERSMIYTALTRSSKVTVFTGCIDCLKSAVESEARWKKLNTLFNLDRYIDLNQIDYVNHFDRK